jgi:hypothetical protein
LQSPSLITPPFDFYPVILLLLDKGMVVAIVLMDNNPSTRVKEADNRITSGSVDNILLA